MAQEGGNDTGGMALRSATKLEPTQDKQVLVQRILEMLLFIASSYLEGAN